MRLAGGWEPRRGDVGGVAERKRGGVEGETLHGCPKIKGIALAVAGEALIDLPIKLDGEVEGGSRRAAGDRTGAAKLGTSPPGRLEADPFQDLGHGDESAKLAIVDAGHESGSGEAVTWRRGWADWAAS